jgi:hypothetical protein
VNPAGLQPVRDRVPANGNTSIHASRGPLFGISGDDTRPPLNNSGVSPDRTIQRKSPIVNIKLSYITPLLVVGAASVAITSAPIAAAGPASFQPSCTQNGMGSECQSAGNAEINDSPPPVSYNPYGVKPWLGLLATR